MKLENTTLILRERTKWEAADLGILLVRKFWKQIYSVWVIFTLPIVMTLALCFRGYSYISILILWWLKPLFDRIPLFLVSRLFFGRIMRIGEVLRSLPRMALKGLVGDLTFRRFNPWRAYTMPVRCLEGLKRAALKKRIDVIARNGRGTAFVVTISSLLFEAGLFFGWFILIAIFISDDFLDTIGSMVSGTSDWISVLHVFLYYLSLSIVEPFFIASGFSLYINRRVYLEGWDIELAFRRLNARFKSQQAHSGFKAVGLLLLFLFIFSNPLPAGAEPETGTGRLFFDNSFASVEEDIERVLARPEFETNRTRTRWRWRWRNQENTLEKPQWKSVSELLSKIASFIAAVLPWLLGSALLTAAIAIIIRRRGIRSGLKGLSWLKPLFNRQPESIMTDGPSQPLNAIPDARLAWQKGRFRDALSLLYRGALCFLVKGRGVMIPESSTERECLQIVKRELRSEGEDSIGMDFSSLVGAWGRSAYAGLYPDNAAFNNLCERWSVYLNERPPEEEEPG